MHWYLIRAKPQQEKLADLHLRQANIETFLPLLRSSELVYRWSPLFPGYLFARFDVSYQCRTVKYAKGVKNIVQFGEHPAEVSQMLIDAIKEREREGFVTLGYQPYEAGQVVHIHSGPLAGLKAIFVRQMSGRKRGFLLLKAVSAQMALVLGREHVCLP